MTPTPENLDRSASDERASLVARAADALRDHIDPGWVDARDRIRSAALSATRRTWPLALRGEPDLYVSDQVVIALLREAIDGVAHVSAAAILITPDDDLVDLVTIEISVEYDYPILPLVDEVRRRTRELIRDLLAPVPDGADGTRPPIDVGVVSVTTPR